MDALQKQLQDALEGQIVSQSRLGQGYYHTRETDYSLGLSRPEIHRIDFYCHAHSHFGMITEL